MNCRKVNQMLSAYMDAELQGVEHRQIFEHLARCPECEREYRNLLTVKRMLSGLKSPTPPARAPERILDYIALEESRRPSRWSQAWFAGLEAQIADWWRDQAGSPRTLAALGGALVLALLARNGLLPSHAAVNGAPGASGGRFVFVPGDEEARMPRAPRLAFPAYTTNLQPYRVASRIMTPVEPRWRPLPWGNAESNAPAPSSRALTIDGDPVNFLRVGR